MLVSGHRIIHILTLLSGLLILLGCEEQMGFTGTDGFLKGIVNIGPICPVETNPPDSGCMPTAETYKSYPVSIWTTDGKKKIAQILPQLNGSYITELPPGDYRVILEKYQNGLGGSNLPDTVSIASKAYTTLNITIDTGIR